MILTDTQARGFVPTLTTGILAAVFVILGVVFTATGSVVGLPAFRVLGPIFLAVGVVAGIFALVWRARSRRLLAAEVAARTFTSTALVVSAIPNLNVQVNNRFRVRLAVQLGGGVVERTMYVPPMVFWRPGDQIRVAYDPAEPRNLVPVDPMAPPAMPGVPGGSL